MDGDADMIPSSLSAETSPSSSDVATESTWSFFRDRSTTLGTLMGVSLADEEQEQVQDHHHHSGQDAVEGTGTPRAPVHEGEGWRWRRRWRRRHWRSAGGGGWWRLCRDDVRVPTSLGHFLDVERRLSGAGLLCGGDGAGERDAAAAAAVAVAADETGRWKLRRPAQGTSSSLARLPVLLTAICSGGTA
ncbi:uncharacterized protein At3g17950-like [Miscanthus floridulus]|uniref:uncharacterized protein At3g17950-like n=1 Tax=Miscanthus floridulus TaxID=154761 RepID=UPI003459FB52